MTSNRKLHSLLIDCRDVIDAIIEIQSLVEIFTLIEDSSVRQSVVQEYLRQINGLIQQYKDLDFRNLD